MGSLVILYENFADQGIITGGSWLSSLSLANLQNADIAKVARSTDAANASTKFDLDLGLAPAVGGFAIGPGNLSPGATWRVRGYSDAAYSSLSYDSVIQTVAGSVIDWSDVDEWLEWEHPGFWYGIEDFANFDELPQYMFHIIPEASAALALVQYWRFEFFDTGNTSGAIDLGRLLVGRAFRPAINYGEDNALTPNHLTDVEESLGGFRTYFERGVRRSFRAALPMLTEAELFGDAFSMILRSGISRQVFVVPDPDDNLYSPRRSFLATLTRAPPLQQLLVQRGTMAVDVEEVL